MRILIIGCVEFSRECLIKLIKNKETIEGVITKASSSFNSDFVDLAPICVENNIPYIYTNDVNNEITFNFIKNLNIDIIYVLGWSSIIGKDIISIPPRGVVGFHPAKLPMNRGRHPIIWALALGLKETASTFFQINEGVDSGDILSQEIIKINEEDDALSLYGKITSSALDQLINITNAFKSHNIKKIQQDDQFANYWRKRSVSDGLIDFRMSSKAIYNLVRALSKPYPGAHIIWKEKIIKIWKIETGEASNENIEPGKVLKINGNVITVKTYDGTIHLLNHEFHELPKLNSYL
jgi:methionyl-tRNA formyltransferase